MPLGAFTHHSHLTDAGLSLALAPALTPTGVADAPSFFHGFSRHPQVLARGLVTLADITATRYVKHTPTTLRDPVLTAHGDRLRAECFSACNGVYARLDLLGPGFDGGDIAHGTTNVDIGPATRAALATVGRDQLLHVDVGTDGLTLSGPDDTTTERPVQMPDRWVRALGNVAEIHHGLGPAFTLDAAGATRFIASLPPVTTTTTTTAWLTPTPTGVRVSPRPRPGAVHVAGLHRLAAAKRLLPHVRGLTVYGPASAETGCSAVEIDLPDARLVLGLTAEPWRGYSGEGSLLESLAEPTALEDADLVGILLAFEPAIDVPRLARAARIDEARVRAALAVLAVSGRVGWDVRDGAHFHRELPDDPARVAKDNPRLVAARRLVEGGSVTGTGTPDEWTVRSTGPDGTTDYVVHRSPGIDRCTCAWYLAHAGGRGPCKHVLAVQITAKEAR